MGRSRKIDEAKVIAGVLMFLDHALAVFAEEATLALIVRQSLTRASQPLYAFCFVFLLTKRGPGQGVISRASPLLGWGILTSLGWSYHYGQPMADILVSFAAALPALPFVSRLGSQAQAVAAVLFSALSIPQLETCGVLWDYSPALILAQACVVVAFVSGGIQAAIPTAFASLLGAVLGFALSARFEIAITGNAIGILTGPIVAALVWAAFSTLGAIPDRSLWIARHPLHFYAGHLLLLFFGALITPV